MEKISGLDASWFHFETEDTPLHVSSVPIFQLPDDESGDTFFEELRALVRSKLPHVKAYRLRRKTTPFNIDHPVWIDDANVDVTYHVRRAKLPQPGNQKQLENAIARITAQPMDLDRPLWEYHLIEGLEGNRVALMIKMHHSIIDGESGVAVLNSVLSPSPEKVDIPEDADELPRAEDPEPADLISEAFAAFLRYPFEMMRQMPKMADAAAKASTIAFQRIFETDRWQVMAPSTPFNKSVSHLRKFAMTEIPLSEAKAIKNALGVTLNDVVMGISAGALRRYLVRHKELPNDPLLAMVPVSLRGKGGKDDHVGTQVTGMISGLATHIADPIARIRKIHENNNESKRDVQAMSGGMIQNYNVFGAPEALRMASQMYGALRLADFHQPTFNVTISNVAGPRQTLYLNGAKMLHYHPCSLVVHGQGLNITVQSYEDSLDFGLLSCRQLMPDLDEFRDDLLDSFEELRAIVLGEPEEADTPKMAKAAE